MVCSSNGVPGEFLHAAERRSLWVEIPLSALDEHVSSLDYIADVLEGELRS